MIKLTPFQKRQIVRRFIDFRRKNLLTQAQMGELVGVGRCQISIIECGHQTPHRSTLKRLVMLEDRAKNSKLKVEFLKGRLNDAGKDAGKALVGTGGKRGYTVPDFPGART